MVLVRVAQQERIDIRPAVLIFLQSVAQILGDIARLTGAWNDDEARAFQEAMSAMSSLPDDAPAYLSEEARRKKESGG